MASFRRAVATSRTKKCQALGGKENLGYIDTPESKRNKNMELDVNHSKNIGSTDKQSGKIGHFKRNSRVSQSLRDVVGNFKQKLKVSTRQRKRLHDVPHSPFTSASRFRNKKLSKRTPTTKGGYREVKMYSPFSIQTPKTQKDIAIRTRPKWHDIETPTRLRKEVEDLTANMQALVNLTPRTLQTRASSRRSLLSASPLTSGCLESSRSTRSVTGTTSRKPCKGIIIS